MDRAENPHNLLLTNHVRLCFDGCFDIRSSADYRWIGKLYPAVFTDEKTVLFLSVDKLIRKNTPLVEKSYYFTERLVKDAIIFIDEFDATKENILTSIIESGLKHRVSVLDLFLNIHNHLVQSECPAGLLRESNKRKEQAFPEEARIR